MAALGFYLTHPQVVQDPLVPVPRWSLTAEGRARIELFAAQRRLPGDVRIVSSLETKALETAAIMAEAGGGGIEAYAEFAENDRSAVGFVPREKFEALADAFFAEPEISASGWERAVDAQARVVAAFERVLEGHDMARPLLLVGHGAVGTLLKCALGKRKIARDEDQRRVGDPGGGNIFAFEIASRTLLSDWMAVEDYRLGD